MSINLAMSLLPSWTDVAPLVLILCLIAIYMYLSPAPNKEKGLPYVEDGTHYPASSIQEKGLPYVEDGTHYPASSIQESILEHGTSSAYQRKASSAPLNQARSESLATKKEMVYARELILMYKPPCPPPPGLYPTYTLEGRDTETTTDSE